MKSLILAVDWMWYKHSRKGTCCSSSENRNPDIEKSVPLRLRVLLYDIWYSERRALDKTLNNRVRSRKSTSWTLSERIIERERREV